MDRIIYFVTEDWYFLSHRLPAARTAKEMGLRVHVITQVSGHAKEIEQEGFTLHPISMNRGGIRVADDYLLMKRLVDLFREIKPSLVHNVAIKPIIYGSEAAKRTSNPLVINAFAGLGFVFSSSSAKAQLLRPLVSAALRRAHSKPSTTALFQNHDDLSQLVNSRIVRKKQTVIIPGSGVDTELFDALPFHQHSGKVVVVGLPARLLIDKGVLDFVEAARELRSRQSRVRMVLVGEPDPLNPTSVTPRQIEEWEKQGLIEYWGWSADMSETLRRIDIACLPSYREGLPKSLLEASSAGLPVITTDVPGCRDAIIPGVTGIRVPAHSPTDLAQAIHILASAPKLREAMGQAGRQHAIRTFSNEVITSQVRQLYATALQQS